VGKKEKKAREALQPKRNGRWFETEGSIPITSVPLLFLPFLYMFPLVE